MAECAIQLAPRSIVDPLRVGEVRLSAGPCAGSLRAGACDSRDPNRPSTSPRQVDVASGRRVRIRHGEVAVTGAHHESASAGRQTAFGVFGAKCFMRAVTSRHLCRLSSAVRKRVQRLERRSSRATSTGEQIRYRSHALVSHRYRSDVIGVGAQDGEGFALGHVQLYHGPTADPVPESLDLAPCPGFRVVLVPISDFRQKTPRFRPRMSAASGFRHQMRAFGPNF